VPFLLDTGILVRLANTADSNHPLAVSAVTKLHRSGESLHITAQNIIEFRNVATRPKAQNGLGIAALAAESQIADFEATFAHLPEIPDIYPAWKSLVMAAGTVGKQVHGARLVAVCQVHAVSHVLTFNVAHFKPLSVTGRVVLAVRPADI
jgi:predicted nucleic acid-binding protein